MKAELEHIYLHVPFCQTLCPFCDFARVRKNELFDGWLQAIRLEVENTADILKREKGKIKTLYLGGGSPSLLSLDELDFLLSPLEKYFENAEITLEINPHQFDEEYLKGIQKLGINRLSIGVQSFDTDRLKRIGRPPAEKTFELIRKAKELGFENLSVDLIYGWPDQSFQELVSDLYTFLSLGVDHLSIYSLQIEENSAFGKAGMENLDEDMEGSYYLYICQLLKRFGYEHYEISSFAKNGRQSRHNLSYWQDRYYHAIGYGAVGYDSRGYFDHGDSLQEYIENPVSRFQGDREAFDAIMMGLRTVHGIDLRNFQNSYGFDLKKRYQSVLEKYRAYFHLEDGRLSLNETGRNILHTILLDFMD